MKIYQGIPVAPGVAIGLIAVVESERFHIVRREIAAAQVPDELKRLDAAFGVAANRLGEKRDEVSAKLGKEYGQIFEAHLLVLLDKKLRREIEERISNKLYSAERAVDATFERYAELLRGLRDASYAERANDIIDVKDRLLRELIDVRRKKIADSENATILAASKLAPSDAANLDPRTTKAIVTETGGFGSHTAIVASALQIPTVLGVGPFLEDVDDDELAIVDGDAGKLILDPTVEVCEKYAAKRDARLRAKADWAANLTNQPVRTLDGAEIKINGNIEFPFEAQICFENGATGVGLYRTEFLFLGETAQTLPDEETHFQAYKRVVESMGNLPVVVRTFDLGADKLPEGVSFTKNPEPNPFMGLRSIRLSLRNTEMFQKQLRAILRASVFGKLGIMFPLVSTITEFRHAKTIFRNVCEDLYDEGVPFDPRIPLGMMVETPAAAIMLEQFVQEVDFFSVGTNDLLQYSMAVDRSNKDVNALYQQESPALIRFVKYAIDVANTYGKPISLCGQMGSIPRVVPLLLGIGLRSLSVAPGMIPQIKRICENVSIADCREIAANAVARETAQDVRAYLTLELQKRYPNLEFGEV